MPACLTALEIENTTNTKHMKHTTLKIAGMALAIAATAFTARADVTLSPNVATYGYVSALLGYTQYPGGSENSSTSLDVNAAKLGFAFNFAPVTAKLSFYHTPDTTVVLEANATYDFGDGLTATGGRFQSWLGYEPFDVPNCNFITNGNEISDLIPNFHEGVHVDYTFGKNTVGVAVVDSIYTGVNSYRGDGKLSDGYGVEAHYGYNDGNLSIGATLAYQNNRSNNVVFNPDSTWNNTYVGDLWAQYIIAQKTTLAAEIYYKRGTQDGYENLTQYYGLVTLKQQITDQFSLAGRVSSGSSKSSSTTGSGNFWKISVTPAFAATKNLVIAGEINYSKYNKVWADGGKDSNAFVGVLACFHF